MSHAGQKTASISHRDSSYLPDRVGRCFRRAAGHPKGPPRLGQETDRETGSGRNETTKAARWWAPAVEDKSVRSDDDAGKSYSAGLRFG